MALTVKTKRQVGKGTSSQTQYWRVENVEVNVSTSYALVYLVGYASQADAKARSNRIDVRQVEIRKDRFDDFFANKGGSQFGQAYRAAVALDPFFANAKKV